MIKVTKKFCSLIISVAIIISLFVCTFASETTAVYSDNITATAGSTISVPVKISDNSGFMGFSIVLEFDSSVFTPVSVESGDILSNGSLTDSIGGTLQSNIVKVVYTDSSSVFDNGLLFNIVFNVSDKATGTQLIKLSYNSKDTFDENFNAVTFLCKDFSISVENEYIENAVKFDGGSLSVNAGEILTVPVSVTNVAGMNSFNLNISYNQNVFEFIGYNSGEILKDGNVSLNKNDFVLGFSWEGLDVDKDGNLLYVSFKVAEYIEKQEEIIISCESLAFENGSSKQSYCCNSQITINNPYADMAAFIYTDKCVSVENDYVDIPVYINNNHGMMGFGIDISYDNAVLTPISVTKSEIVSNGLFGDNTDNAYGKIKIRWNHSEDIFENGLLFTMRFKVLNSESITTIPLEFSYSQPDTYNEKWEDVKLDINIETITLEHTYTIRFVVDGVVASSQKFVSGTSVNEIVLPQIPRKIGYNGQWETFLLGNNDVDVNCIYTPIVYTATFIDNGKVISTDTFTVEDDSLDYPYISKWAYYDWVWDEHKIEAKDLTIEGRYVPTTYTITFVSNGETIKTQEYNVDTVDSIVAPAKSLPAKQHYTTAWEDWTGKVGNITVNEIYVPIKYKISFYCQNKLVATRSYTIEISESQVILPTVPKVDGYDVKWPELKFEYKDQEVHAIYTPVVYTAQFVAEGIVVDTQTFTVETEKLNEPAVPQKAGYIASWSGYVLEAKDIIIYAKYYPPEVVMKAKATMKIDETNKLLTSCNFDVTRKSWSSSNPEVATVDNHGNITAVEKGECKITVTCYGKDSFGNEIKATAKAKITVKEQLSTETLKERFRAAFDEFFQVKLHDIVFNFKEFMIILFRYAY